MHKARAKTSRVLFLTEGGISAECCRIGERYYTQTKQNRWLKSEAIEMHEARHFRLLCQGD